MGGEKVADGGVVELFPVISLQGANRATKLRRHIRVEGSKGDSNFRLLTQWKGPHKVRVVIQNNKIIRKTSVTSNRRGPDITMD